MSTIRANALEKLKQYWWLALVFLWALHQAADISFSQIAAYAVGLIILLFLFLPFLIQIFSPAFVLIFGLTKHFKESKGMSIGRKAVFVPMSIVSAASFSTAQLILLAWIFIIGFSVWAEKIGFFWTLFLTFFLGLAPLIVATAPLLVWFSSGFLAFLSTAIFFLMALVWYVFSKLAFAEDYYTSSAEDFLGYSPQIFLLGALSFQVIGLPFYHYGFSNIGDYISDFGGFVFLILALIAAIKWRSLKKILLIDEMEGDFYRPSAWIYGMGFIFVTLLFASFMSYGAPTGVLFWLNSFFVTGLLANFGEKKRRKRKINLVDRKLWEGWLADEEVAYKRTVKVPALTKIVQGFRKAIRKSKRGRLMRYVTDYYNSTGRDRKFAELQARIFCFWCFKIAILTHVRDAAYRRLMLMHHATTIQEFCSKWTDHDKPEMEKLISYTYETFSYFDGSTEPWRYRGDRGNAMKFGNVILTLIHHKLGDVKIDVDMGTLLLPAKTFNNIQHDFGKMIAKWMPLQAEMQVAGSTEAELIE